MPMGGSKQEQSGAAVGPAVPHPQLCCGLRRRLPAATAAGCRGAKTGGVEELHIVAHHDAYPQTVEQSGEQ